MRNIVILVSLFLIFALQSSFAQINTTNSIDKLNNNTAALITEDSIVGEKLEQVQNRSNTTGQSIENSQIKSSIHNLE
ncbi:MAG TPA: hypothetical protein VFM31_06945 [Nitrososphaeraceae archaeon]|jgi:hypothetical protein|nr:hypothetical protein [Nitrososphaeraceae archaeon]